jgi:hypothetical protein
MVKRTGLIEKIKKDIDAVSVKNVCFAPNVWGKSEVTASLFAGFTKM